MLQYVTKPNASATLTVFPLADRNHCCHNPFQLLCNIDIMWTRVTCEVAVVQGCTSQTWGAPFPSSPSCKQTSIQYNTTELNGLSTSNRPLIPGLHSFLRLVRPHYPCVVYLCAAQALPEVKVDVRPGPRTRPPAPAPTFWFPPLLMRGGKAKHAWRQL